jgi:hypothetical protein
MGARFEESGMKALVIGGTGPTGPFVVNGLLERGYRVSLLNRGTREAPEIPRAVERIVGDPHFPETLREALGKRRFDLIVAMYGRMRYIAELAGEHAERLITIGGSPQFSPSCCFPAASRRRCPRTRRGSRARRSSASAISRGSARTR